MSKIAIMGFGTVGSGVYEAVKINQSGIAKRVKGGIEVAHILDKRSFPSHEARELVTSDTSVIFGDAKVDVVVECMGGSHPAYEFSKAALESGKSVVTSNKECVEKFGEELESLAAANGVCYLYEASAGGGIPCIHTIKNCLAWGELKRISGILNGTTNYILTAMENEKLSFDEALANAQKLGFAEADPTADVRGFDAARKICILGGIAWDCYLKYTDIPVIEGITEITREDLAEAGKAGYAIKLIACAERDGNGISLAVSPMLVHREHIFASVGGSYNAVSILGTTADEIVLYGRGAGSLPTANAIVSDIVEALTSHPIPSKRGTTPHIKPVSEFNDNTFTLASGKRMRVFG